MGSEPTELVEVAVAMLEEEENELSWLDVGKLSEKFDALEENPLSELVNGTFGFVSALCKKLKSLKEKAVSWPNVGKPGFASKVSEEPIF